MKRYEKEERGGRGEGGGGRGEERKVEIKRRGRKFLDGAQIAIEVVRRYVYGVTDEFSARLDNGRGRYTRSPSSILFHPSPVHDLNLGRGAC